MLIRQVIGALALVALLVIMIFVESEPVVRGANLLTDFAYVLGMIIMTIWLVTSGILKLSMVFNKRWFKFNAFSSIFWVVLMLLIILPIHSHTSTANQYSAIQNFAGFFIFFGWFAIDLADKFYMLRHTRPVA